MASSARLVFVSETTVPIIEHARDPGCWKAPSASEIAAATAKHPDHVLGGGRQEWPTGQSRGPEALPPPRRRAAARHRP